ncbi:hypothetical protein COEREDRAFT_86198 [Coemansia reversa NRRL 1564]|uniref:Uncharacterized protein n=1 Tax=Coemansia reversa (strain ATCC 12441 / NRRL 1564) TaxID=763665 RepID=A0A2G5BDX7_COERN|nr:hypothetical protein COEREDRAFT_86198 [Coemansia reversa NRRL 1564]|eukprot:PIA17192.1 hypothetical protein COEREDRAFT_86198 [Coemansia reversa NRRL 1564]
MGDEGLRSSEDYWKFVKENKNAILVFARHDKISWERYISTTKKLIWSTIERDDKRNEFSCERFYTKHVSVPSDVFSRLEASNNAHLNGGNGDMWMVDRVPDKGALFYRNGEFVNCQVGWDIEEFERNLINLEFIDIEEKRQNAAAAAKRPAKAPVNNGECCIIL